MLPHMKNTRICCVLIMLAIAVATSPFVSAAAPEPVRVVLDDNYPPLSFRDKDGRLQGILIDQWMLWQQKTGVPVLLSGMAWTEAFGQMRSGNFDVIDTISINEERKEWLDFSAPYFNMDVPIFFRRDIGGIAGVESLKGFKVGVKKNDNVGHILRDKGIDDLVEFPDAESVVKAAGERKIVVFAMGKPPSLYYLYKMGLQKEFNFTKASLYDAQFFRAVPKGKAALQQQVEAGFGKITPKEYDEIERRWMGESAEANGLLRHLYWILGCIAAMAGILAIWNLSLKRKVRLVTSEIQLLNEQLEAKVEERTQDLFAANQELAAMNEEVMNVNELVNETNQRLQHEIANRKKAETRLLTRERRYQVTAGLLTGSTENTMELLESILQNALHLINAPDGYIGLYADDGKTFIIHYGMGVHAARVQEPISTELGMQEQVYRSGKSLYISDYRQYPNRINDPRLARMTSIIMVPLIMAGKVAGALAASWVDVENAVSSDDRNFLEQFAHLASMVFERVKIQEKIRNIAFHDVLTGLSNRAHLKQCLEEELKKSRAGESQGIVLFIDLDDLKTINDNFGHSSGDQVIVTAAALICGAVGKDAFVSRIGGDEFIVFISGEISREEAGKVAEKTSVALSAEYQVAGHNMLLSASIGLVMYPEDGTDAEEILKKADIAMYAAKKVGKNCWRFYESALVGDSYENMMLTNQLRRALDKEELCLYYQPQVSPDGKKVVGFEALLRWKHPEHGFLSPARFVILAEQSGLILPIGEWVLQQACRFAHRIKECGYGEIRVSVNISPRQLETDSFVDTVRETVERAGITPGQLGIEVTETVMMESLENSVSKMRQLKEWGVHLALDDFGTGYSSLTYLRTFPVTMLKIDKSFIDRILIDKIQLQVVDLIINLGHTLGMVLVAEGVETEEQLLQLRQLRCDCIQGYVFSRPVPEDEALQFIVRTSGEVLPSRDET